MLFREKKTVQAIDDMLEQQVMDGLLQMLAHNKLTASGHVRLMWQLERMRFHQCLIWRAINDMLEQQIIVAKPVVHKKIYHLTSLMSCWNSSFFLGVGSLGH